MSNFSLNWNEKELTVKVRAASVAAVRAGANAVAREAERRCPKDTGDLSRTIEVVEWSRPDAVGAYIKAGGEDMGHIARFVELGTPGKVFNAGVVKGKERTPIKAQAFLRPALKKKRKVALAAMKDAIK